MFESTSLAATAASFCFVPFTLGRIPEVTQWIRAGLLKILLTRFLKLSTRGTTSPGSATSRRTFSTVSLLRVRCRRGRARGFTLVFTFPTFAGIVSEAANISIGNRCLLLSMGRHGTAREEDGLRISEYGFFVATFSQIDTEELQKILEIRSATWIFFSCCTFYQNSGKGTSIVWGGLMATCELEAPENKRETQRAAC